ncbi:MAG: hypothetical protein IPJ65_20775 [Archangiaceae bacterium]|nr:hypothetical protein [Archangiaceae bacterium]
MSSTRETFDTLADRWLEHCAEHPELSNPAAYVRHESYDAIVALGAAAVPLIIDRYREGSLFWGHALARITGIATFGDGLTGNLEATRRQWLDWAAKQ